jgi:hypothetical protein
VVKIMDDAQNTLLPHNGKQLLKLDRF